MIKVGVADYGMWVWDGGLFDYEQRCKEIKTIGYDGLERLRPVSESDAIYKAGLVRKLGMSFGTCLAPDTEHSIAWSAALGKDYVWVNVTAKDFDTFCRQVNVQVKICKAWGIKAALHNHLGSLVETQEELLAFLERCPECYMVLDTGHLAVAKGGDPLFVIKNYFDRLASVHVKEWVMENETAEEWYNKGRFCELGGGNFKIDNELCINELVKKGYDGWIFVEHDTHLREPLEDLKISREYLKKLGV